MMAIWYASSVNNIYISIFILTLNLLTSRYSSYRQTSTFPTCLRKPHHTPTTIIGSHPTLLLSMDIEHVNHVSHALPLLGYLPALTFGQHHQYNCDDVRQHRTFIIIFPLNSHHRSNLSLVFPVPHLSNNLLPIMNFDSLKEQVSNLSLYDIKAGVRKVQNGK